MRPMPFPTSHDHVFFSSCALASLKDGIFHPPVRMGEGEENGRMSGVIDGETSPAVD